MYGVKEPAMPPTLVETPDAPASDLELLARSRAGDRDAFGLLYDRHVRPVHAQAFAVVRDRQVAEDVTQDVFITCWQKIRHVHVVDSSVLPWLMVTARYTALNVARKRQRDAARTTELSDRPDPVSIDSTLDAAEATAAIETAVASLSGPDRRVYELCVDGDHSYEAAARELGVSQASVRNRLSRVRARLRADLAALKEA